MILSDAQEQAVAAIIRWWQDPDAPQVFRMFGYAGTGKTTIWAEVRRRLRRLGAEKIITCAFTGKAANVLRQKGTPGAMTFHAATYSPIEVNGHTKFIKNDLGPAATADLIGLDECSMINDPQAEDLLSFGKRVLVMGDPGQLPPVKGTGAFINPAHKPDVFLTEIHRQAAESPIIRLATMARKGERIPPGDYGQGVVVEYLSKDSSERVYDGHTMPIVGKHATRYTITAEMRKRQGFGGELPVAGEKLMCMRNDSQLGIFNGQLGIALKSRLAMSGDLIMTPLFEDCTADLDDLVVMKHHFLKHRDPTLADPPASEFRGKQQFDFGYVITAHKAQGSSWPHVTIVDDSGAFRESASKWLYTAITRAETGLHLLLRR